MNKFEATNLGTAEEIQTNISKSPNRVRDKSINQFNYWQFAKDAVNNVWVDN